MMHPKQLLQLYDIAPKKSLGQNFLFDLPVLSRIVDAAQLSADESVLEIGPGLGSLTHVLASRAAEVVAVELDDRLIPILQGELGTYDNVTIRHGDILKQDPAALFDRDYKVVANVPYYITGAILKHLLSAPQKPLMMVLTVQKEVAERVVAEPPNMSLLGVSVQYYGTPTIVDTIKAGAFWPRPDVDSAVLRIDLTGGQRATDEQRFFKVAKAGFSQKRKQLKNNLGVMGFSKDEISAGLAQRKSRAAAGRRPLPSKNGSVSPTPFSPSLRQGLT